MGEGQMAVVAQMHIVYTHIFLYGVWFDPEPGTSPGPLDAGPRGRRVREGPRRDRRDAGPGRGAPRAGSARVVAAFGRARGERGRGERTDSRHPGSARRLPGFRRARRPGAPLRLIGRAPAHLRAARCRAWRVHRPQPRRPPRLGGAAGGRRHVARRGLRFGGGAARAHLPRSRGAGEARLSGQRLAPAAGRHADRRARRRCRRAAPPVESPLESPCAQLLSGARQGRGAPLRGEHGRTAGRGSSRRHAGRGVRALRQRVPVRPRGPPPGCGAAARGRAAPLRPGHAPPPHGPVERARVVRPLLARLRRLLAAGRKLSGAVPGSCGGGAALAPPPRRARRADAVRVARHAVPGRGRSRRHALVREAGLAHAERMVGRPPAALSALALGASLASCREPARPLARGTTIDLEGVPSEYAALVWVVPAAELRVCAPVAGSLRRFQGPVDSRLVVVFVGQHPEWMAAHLRAQRLRATLIPLSRAEYAARFGGTAVHALYRVRGRRVVEALPPDPERLEARLRAEAAAEGPPRVISP